MDESTEYKRIIFKIVRRVRINTNTFIQGRLTCSLWGYRVLLTSSDERWQCTLKRAHLHIKCCEAEHFQLSLELVQCPVSSPGGPGACQTRSRLGQAFNIGTQTEETNIIRVRVFPPVGRIINEERSVGFHTVKYWHVENSINILFVTKVSVLCA